MRYSHILCAINCSLCHIFMFSAKCVFNARWTHKQRTVWSGMLHVSRCGEPLVGVCWVWIKTLNVLDDGAGKVLKRVGVKVKCRNWNAVKCTKLVYLNHVRVCCAFIVPSVGPIEWPLSNRHCTKLYLDLNKLHQSGIFSRDHLNFHQLHYITSKK